MNYSAIKLFFTVPVFIALLFLNSCNTDYESLFEGVPLYEEDDPGGSSSTLCLVGEWWKETGFGVSEYGYSVKLIFKNNRRGSETRVVDCMQGNGYELSTLNFDWKEDGSTITFSDWDDLILCGQPAIPTAEFFDSYQCNGDALSINDGNNIAWVRHGY